MRFEELRTLAANTHMDFNLLKEMKAALEVSLKREVV